MKTIKTLLLVVAITVSSMVSASTEPTKSETKVTNEISKLLKNPKFSLKKEMLVMVEITLNDKNEMVVLSTNSDNRQITDYIKNRLNYVKLNSQLDSKLDTFKVPVRIVPKS